MRRISMLLGVMFIAAIAWAQEVEISNQIGFDEPHPILERQRAVNDKALIDDGPKGLAGIWEGSRVSVLKGRSSVEPVRFEFDSGTVTYEERVQDGSWERTTARFSLGGANKHSIVFNDHQMEIWLKNGEMTLIEKTPPTSENAPVFEGVIYSLKRRTIKYVQGNDELVSP